MSNLVAALDNYTPVQLGENSHPEYGWSNQIQEKIVQFSFQLTRTDEDGIKKLKIILIDLISSIDFNMRMHIDIVDECKKYLSILYRMIGHTRDIIDGKGECALTYMMIHTWYNFYPKLSFFALKCLVNLGDSSIHQYGSWKDIKYFCEYCKTQKADTTHPLIKYAVTLINKQIRSDCENNVSYCSDISLAAKWAPREKSSFGWLYQLLATDYNKQFITTAHTEGQKKRAILKCKTEYRKVLSTLNIKIDTLQIKQCNQEWATINFDKVTSISLSKQNKAFLNIIQNGETRQPDKQDRVMCAENFSSYINNVLLNKTEMKGDRVGMVDFTKRAIRLHKSANTNQLELDLINSQWRNNSSQTGALGKMIAMVDVSGSMNGDPMHAAVALGIRIAEKSVLGKRVMTFSSTPTWVNLEPCPDFVSQVTTIMSSDWGGNTNLYAAFDTILNAIVANNISTEEVEDMILVVLSDMQIDESDTCDKQKLYDAVSTKYSFAGICSQGKAYKPPHILFWNLKSTSGFPCLSNQPNVSMMSGFSPALLNVFCEQGLDALTSFSPWNLLEMCLKNERYAIMKEEFDKEI